MIAVRRPQGRPLDLASHEMDQVADGVKDEEALDRIGAEVREFCRDFPAPGMGG